MRKRRKQPQSGQMHDHEEPRKLYEPNRIAEYRDDRGWSQEDLAEQLGSIANVTTTGAQIGKLERRERQLTVKWMNALSKVFDIDPIDLLDLAAMAGTTNDVEPQDGGSHAAALSQRGLRYYNVISDACSEGGYQKGKSILVDETKEAIAGVQTGDFVLVETRPGKSDSLLLLRVYVAPGLLVTNKPSSNTAMKIGKNKIRAVVVPENNRPT
jgi:transcriptional regulator with XRE-family HTH domain